MTKHLLLTALCAAFLTGCATRDDAAFNKEFAEPLNNTAAIREHLKQTELAVKQNPTPETVRAYDAALMDERAARDTETALRLARKHLRPKD